MRCEACCFVAVIRIATGGYAMSDGRGGTIVVEMSGVGVMLDERLGDGGD